MARIQIDGKAVNPVAIFNPVCKGQGQCVQIQNVSPADDLYYGDNLQLMQAALSTGKPTYGFKVAAGTLITIPWVSGILYAYNIIGAPTPNDFFEVESWG